MIVERNVFDQPVEKHVRNYKNIRKTAADQGDDYATDCLLGYPYFKENYKLVLLVNKKHKMQIQKQCKKLILMEI